MCVECDPVPAREVEKYQSRLELFTQRRKGRRKAAEEDAKKTYALSLRPCVLHLCVFLCAFA
jgi:hypothetical protein